MQVTTAREPKPYETQQPTAGYADKQQDTTILGQQTTSLQATLPAHSRQHTDHATHDVETDHQAQTSNTLHTPTHLHLFSYTPTLGTLTPSLCAYPRNNLFLLMPDSARCLLSRVLSLLSRGGRYLSPSFRLASPRALEQGGI
jgi:hypothetical protein